MSGAWTDLAIGVGGPELADRCQLLATLDYNGVPAYVTFRPDPNLHPGPEWWVTSKGDAGMLLAMREFRPAGGTRLQFGAVGAPEATPHLLGLALASRDLEQTVVVCCSDEQAAAAGLVGHTWFATSLGVQVLGSSSSDHGRLAHIRVPR